VIEIFNDFEQGSETWRIARSGIPTASMFKAVMASGRGGGDSIGRGKYMRQLAGEVLSGVPMETYSNGSMKRGQKMEADLRREYAFLMNVEPTRVAFVRNGQKGCSPDSFIGDNGLLEIKSHAPDILIELIMKDEFPPCHRAQTQGQLWVCEREFVDIDCGYTGMPAPLIKRAYRDSMYIHKLAQAVDQFNDELAELVEKIKAYSPSIPAQERAA
jgi:hypothetical protein